jgi:hypothetical protein
LGKYTKFKFKFENRKESKTKLSRQGIVSLFYILTNEFENQSQYKEKKIHHLVLGLCRNCIVIEIELVQQENITT